ncbi:MAG: hypothetical protein DMG90_15400 [Acidobacteria bacterium]|nr:MAG: hypothetical protein DMG90_15400 [Acidobacteriota bacterium]
MRRLGKFGAARQVLPAEIVCPAAGQGALAIEIRARDSATGEAVAFLDHKDTRSAVTCERALLNKMGGGCQVPIGAYAELQGRELFLQAVVANPDGSSVLRESASGADAVTVGEQVAGSLLSRGGRQILQEVYGKNFAIPEQP